MRWTALALVLAPACALAQVELRDGWTFHPRIGIADLEDVACGGDHAAARSWTGSIAVWDGAAWIAPPVDPQASRYGRTLAVAANGHVFLEAGAQLAQWTGSRWVDHRLPEWAGDHDAQIAAVSGSEVYFVGRGRIARFDGARAATYDAGTWRALSAVAVAGDSVLVGGEGGTVLRHRGGRWARERTAIDTTVRRLLAFDERDVWAWANGASSNESIVLHFDGERWERRDPIGLGSAIDAIGGSQDRVYVTGDFGLARWDGARWRVEISPADLGDGYHSLRGVCATRRHHVVGHRSGGALVRVR